MSTTVPRYLKYGGLFAGAVILVPVTYCCFLYFSYVDKEITAGTAYGFTVGQSKQDAYKRAQLQFLNGEITRIDTILTRDEEVKLFPKINGSVSYHTVAEVRGLFENWDQWSLWLNGDKPSLLAILRFQGDRLSGVDSGSPGPGETLLVAGGNATNFRAGQSYKEVYQTLEALSRTPGYERLVLDTGWMARRQPVEFKDAEYRFVAEYDEWTLLVGDSRLNSIQLTFNEGRLVRVHRHRQHFELP
jgi:hypothetical protein